MCHFQSGGGGGGGGDKFIRNVALNLILLGAYFVFESFGDGGGFFGGGGGDGGGDSGLPYSSWSCPHPASCTRSCRASAGQASLTAGVMPASCIMHQKLPCVSWPGQARQRVN